MASPSDSLIEPRAIPVVEWLWRRNALWQARQHRFAPSARALQLKRRASAAVRLAEHALKPRDRSVDGSGGAPACELYRQAIHWLLAANLEQTRGERARNPLLPRDEPELPTLWLETDPELLARAAGSAEGREVVREQAVDRSFVDFAELGPTEQITTAHALRAFARRLQHEVDADRDVVDKVFAKRFSRCAALFVALSVLILAAFYAREVAERRKNLAFEKPWRASSRYGANGCESPKQQCLESPEFFVHTEEEESPWLEFDLQKVVGLSGAHVVNRADCCGERTIPLVIKISEDHTTWTEVLRNSEAFKVWNATFPATKARWVRLQVEGRSVLHLREVRLLR